MALPHRPVEAVVEDFRPRGELRLQDLDLVGPQELVDRVFRILEVDELPRARRAAFAAGRREALRDAVVAQVALVDRLRSRDDEPAPVRAGLHAVAAAKAIGLVHEDGAVGALECGAHGTHLRAGRVRALITELRHEEALGAVAGRVLLGKTVVAAVGRVDVGMLRTFCDVVPLHPGAEEVGLEGHVVLGLAGPHAVAAADALVDVDDHSPVVLGGLVGGLLRLAGLHGLEVGGGRRGQHEELSGREQEVAAVGAHFLGSLSGACGEWQPLHAPPSKWFFGSIWGNFCGFATFARWQVKQIVFGSGLKALLAEGSAACFASAPWQASQPTPACLPPFQASRSSVWHSTQAVRPAKRGARTRLSARAPAR